MPQAFSYTRFSTEKQIKGDSLDRQDTLVAAYAAKHNLTLDKRSYSDLGVSAFKGKNAVEGELAAFLSAVEVGKIPKGSYLLIENIDRLSRDVVTEAVPLFMSIINKGIILVTVDNEAVFSKENIKGDWTKLIIAIAEMARANAESARKSDLVKKGMAAKRALLVPNRNCPSWLQVNDAGTGYVQVAKQVTTIRKIFELSAAGNGIVIIRNYLEEHKIPQLGNASMGWIEPAIARLLHNQAVIGRLVSKANDTTIEDYYPSIIDKHVFFDVQQKMTERKSIGKGRKGEHIANLFSGVGVCGDCGAKMRFVKRTVRNAAGENYAYLHCNVAFYKKGCSAVPLKYDVLESALIDDYLNIWAIEFEDVTATLVDPSIAIRAEIADKEAQVERLMDLMEQEGSQESKNLLGRLSKREEELKELTQKLLNVVVPRASKDVWIEAKEVSEEHRRLKSLPGAELKNIRLKLQNTIKQFVKSVTFPTKIETHAGDIEIKPSRIAYTVFHEKWHGMLLKRDYGAFYADSPEHYEEDMKRFFGSESNPFYTYYEIPKAGNPRGRPRKKATPEF